MTRILIVEDDPRLLATIELQLSEAGFETLRCVEAGSARAACTQPARPDLLLVDVRLPGKSGIDLIEDLKGDGHLPPTIVMSGEATMKETVRALRLGVVDFIEKPFSRERLIRSIELALELSGLRRQVRTYEDDPLAAILGDSPPMHDLKQKIERAAISNARVLIHGESGTGKELVAEALHRLSRRSGAPFVRLNCGALARNLIEDELFGHAVGAFTDAKNERPGVFEVADGGTLFLDEIGDLEEAVQSRLLRVLEDGKVRRLGETRERRVDVRVISATHRPLGAESFRQDLYFRLAELRIEVPPLCERGADIELLFRTFLDQACQREKSRRRTVAPELLERLLEHSWPGNVRELKNVCHHLAVFGGETLRLDDLPTSLSQTGGRESQVSGLLRTAELPPDLSLKELKRQSEREFLEAVLRRFSWNFTRAAEAMQIQRTHLHERARVLGLSRPEKS